MPHMKPIQFIIIAFSLAVGCRLADAQTVGLPKTDSTEASAVGAQNGGSGTGPHADGMLLQPPAVNDQAEHSAIEPEPLPAESPPSSTRLSPDELVQLALSI